VGDELRSDVVVVILKVALDTLLLGSLLGNEPRSDVVT
jgi:hypothetical protein